MSEYQYYEWLSLDRLLSSEEQRAVNALSSHITVSPSGAWVDYSWGDFKHDPAQVLARYFDAFLYMANWGTRELKFRLPRHLLDSRALEPYLLEPYIALDQVDDSYVLTLMLEDQVSEDWVESEEQLATLAVLRTDILHGDYRCLALLHNYIITSGRLEDEEDWEDDEVEVIAPPFSLGLGPLTPTLHTMLEFFEIEPPQADAATVVDAEWQSASETELEKAIDKLSREEAAAFLLRLLHNEPLLSVALRQRLRQFL